MLYRYARITGLPVHQRTMYSYIMNWHNETIPNLLDVFRGLRPEAQHVFLEVNCLGAQSFLGIFSMLPIYELRQALTPSDQWYLRVRHAYVKFSIDTIEVETESPNSLSRRLLTSLQLLQKFRNINTLTIRIDGSYLGALKGLFELTFQHGPFLGFLPWLDSLDLSVVIMGPKRDLDNGYDLELLALLRDFLGPSDGLQWLREFTCDDDEKTDEECTCEFAARLGWDMWRTLPDLLPSRLLDSEIEQRIAELGGQGMHI